MHLALMFDNIQECSLFDCESHNLGFNRSYIYYIKAQGIFGSKKKN